MCNPSRRAILGSGLLTAAVQLYSPSRQIVFVQTLSTITAPPTYNQSPLPPTPVGAKVLDEYSTELNELHRWESLTSGMPFAQRRAEEGALNRPIAGAQYLQALARGLPNNEVDLDHPPSNLTADQRAVIDYVRNTPALRNALDVAGIGGKADGIISANDCDTFIDNECDHADAASKAYNAYLGAHPNADPQSGELTRSAAVLAANQSLLAAAARRCDPGTGSRRSATALVDDSDLSSLARANTEQLSLSLQLVGAAALWSHPGMLATLDQAGDDLATTWPDGVYSAGNITNWISKQSPSTPDQFRELITGAAARDLTHNVSTKGLGYDVFVHPEKYAGPQKTAVLIRLSDLEIKLRAGKNYWDPIAANRAGIGGNTFMNDPIGNLVGQIRQKINQLSRDRDVATFLSQNLPGALREVMQSDPSVTAAARSYCRNDLQTGAALRAALNSAKPGDVPNELANFEQQVGFYDEALGAKMDVRSIVDANPDLKAALRTSANGKTLQSTLHGQQSLQETIGQFNIRNLAYAEAADRQFLRRHVTPPSGAPTTIGHDKILTDMTGQECRQAFGLPSTRFNQHKVEQLIQQRQPLLDSVAGSKTSMDQLVSLAQKVYNQLYKGASLQKLLTGTHERYAATLKAVLAAAALGTSEATGRATRPQTISSALGLTGALAEAGGKTLPQSGDAVVGQLKILGGAGKTIGGMGSGISGYFKLSSGIQELDHGDAARGINSATQGAAGLMSGGAAVVEGVAAGLGAINMTGSANSTAALAGPVGWIAAGIGLVAALTIRAIEDAQHEGRNNHFLYQIAPVLDQYGFSLPAGQIPRNDGFGHILGEGRSHRLT